MAHLGRFFIAIVFVLGANSFSTAATLTVDLNGGVDYVGNQVWIRSMVET